MLVPNRTSSSAAYRYGFQGQEKDDEIKGEGNSLNYTFRMHDARVGRFFAVDPLTHKYPHYTPYSFSGNKVIAFTELEGLEERIATFDAQTEHMLTTRNIQYQKGDLKKSGKIMAAGVAATIVVVTAPQLLPTLEAAFWQSAIWASNPANQIIVYEGTAFASGVLMGDAMQDDIFPNTGSNEVGKAFRKLVKPVSKLIDNVPRGTWQSSEEFIGKLLGKNYKAQQAFLERELQSSRAANSAIPDWFNEITKHAVEVKNYDLTTRSNISNLINTVAGQVNYRHYNLPSGSTQSVYIDITGQNVSKELKKEIIDRITNKLEKNVDATIEFFTQ